MEKLTIAIPTYDRNTKLKKTVDLLIPQLNERVILRIIDNCSLIPVTETLEDYKDDIEIHRNSVNIGMVGNFIKCFESCNTEWLWILGDDDPPYKNSISIIEETITQYPEASFINFKCILAGSREQDLVLHSQEEFINGLDSFGNLLYVSMGVYCIPKMKAGLRALYQYGYSLAPHTALIFAALSDTSIEHTYVLSTNEVVNVDIRDTTAAEVWNWLGISLSLFNLRELGFRISLKSQKIWQSHLKTHIIGPSRVYAEIAKVDSSLSNFTQDLYWYDQIFLRAKDTMSAKEWGHFFYYRIRLYLKYFLKSSKTNNNKSQNVEEEVFKRL